MREIVSPLDGIRSPLGSVSLLALYAVLGFKPKLVLDFDDERYFDLMLTPTTFSDLITHSTSSNATMVDSDGLLKWRPHNLLAYSEQFDNAAWNKATGFVVTSNSTTSPSNTLTADLVTVTSPGFATTLSQSYSPAEADYTASVYLKYDTSQWVQIFFGSTSFSGGHANFDLINGVVGETIVGNASITDAGGGWYRCSLTRPATASGTTSVCATVPVSSGAASRFGSEVSGSYYIWGASLYRSDLGGMVNNPDRGDSYVPTTSSAVYLPRRGHHVYNGTSWVNEGLLHESEARTNLVTYSDFSLGFSNTELTRLGAQEVGPDGENSLSLYTVTTATALHESYTASYGVVSDSVYTHSVVIKKGTLSYFGLRHYRSQNNWATAVFDLATMSVSATGVGATSGTIHATSVENLGNNLYRLSLAASATGTTAVFAMQAHSSSTPTLNTFGGESFTGGSETFYAGFGQMELGSTPSSYIPTSGATVTRAAETLTIPSAKLPWPTPNVIGSEQSPSFSTWAVVLTGTWASGGGAAYAFTDTVGGQTRPGVVWDQAILTAGKVYQAVIDVASITGATQLRIDNLGSSDVLVGAGQTSFEFVAGAFAASSGPRIRIEDASTTLNDGFTINSFSVREIDPLAVSIQMQGRATGDTYTTTRWYLDANNYITQEINTSDFTFEQAASGTVDAVTGGSFTSGVNTPFNFASTHASTLVAAAVGGTALTDNTTPVALADLSSTDLQLGHSFMGTLKLMRVWPQNITEAGREGASA